MKSFERKLFLSAVVKMANTVVRSERESASEHMLEGTTLQNSWQLLDTRCADVLHTMQIEHLARLT